MLPAYRNDGYRDVRVMLGMRPQNLAVVHAIKLIAGQDEDGAGLLVLEIANVLPDGVCGPLVPIGFLVRLLGRQDFDEAPAERVKLVRIRDMAMQADAEKLRQDVDTVESAVKAIADGNVDETILPRDGYGRLAANHRQGIKARAPAAAEYETDNFFHERMLLDEANARKPAD